MQDSNQVKSPPSSKKNYSPNDDDNDTSTDWLIDNLNFNALQEEIDNNRPLNEEQKQIYANLKIILAGRNTSIK